MRFFSHVEIFTDVIPPDFDFDIIKNNSHVNVTIISTNRVVNHLIGSGFELTWLYVQYHHLENLYLLYKYNPNAKWYIAFDDDSYPFPSSILNQLSHLNESKLNAYGYSFSPFPENKIYFQNNNLTHVFFHGGSGIFISRALMDQLAPHLLECNMASSDFLMPSDVRLSLCIEEVFGYYQVQDNFFFFFDGLHPSTFTQYSPRKHDYKLNSYHQINPKTSCILSHASISEFSIDGVDFYTDWSNITLQSIFIDLNGNNHLYQFIFGFALLNSINGFENPSLNTYSDAIIAIAHSSPRPVFKFTPSPTLKEVNASIIKYKQDFFKYKGELHNLKNNDTSSFQWSENNNEEPVFQVEYICKNQLDITEIEFGGLPDIDDNIYRFNLHCPNVSKFLHNFPQGQTPFKRISIESDDLI